MPFEVDLGYAMPQVCKESRTIMLIFRLLHYTLAWSPLKAAEDPPTFAERLVSKWLSPCQRLRGLILGFSVWGFLWNMILVIAGCYRTLLVTIIVVKLSSVVLTIAIRVGAKYAYVSYHECPCFWCVSSFGSFDTPIWL